MNPENENFDSLRRLLALKRHEQPAPRYFNDFSEQVIARIKAGQLGEDLHAAWLFEPPSWLHRFWQVLDAKPILAGAFGVAACAVMLGGVFLAVEQPSNSEASVPQSPNSPIAQIPPAPVNHLLGTARELDHSSSMDGVVQPETSLFKGLDATPQLINLSKTQGN